MEMDEGRNVVFTIDEEVDVNDLPPLLNADTFPLKRLDKLPSTLQELEVENKDDFFPTHFLTDIPNLSLSNLVRLVLNVPITIQGGSLGPELPRSLVTLSMPKATENPPGNPTKLFSLPPQMIYLNVPKLLLDPPSVAFIPRSIKLLSAYNELEIARSVASHNRSQALLLFPRSMEILDNPTRHSPTAARSPSSTGKRTSSSPSAASPATSPASRASRNPPSPTLRKIREHAIPLALDDDDDDVLAPMPPPGSTPRKPPYTPSPTRSHTPSPTRTTQSSSRSQAIPLAGLDDDDEDVLAPMAFPGSRSTTTTPTKTSQAPPLGDVIELD